MFKHNICGDHPKVPDGMPDFADPLPPEFFMNPRCPPVRVAVEAIVAEAAKEPMKAAAVEDHGEL